MAKWIQNIARDTKCGSPLTIFCIPTQFVGDTLSSARGHGGRVVTLSPPTSEAGFDPHHGLKWESW